MRIAESNMEYVIIPIVLLLQMLLIDFRADVACVFINLKQFPQWLQYCKMQLKAMCTESILVCEYKSPSVSSFSGSQEKTVVCESL